MQGSGLPKLWGVHDKDDSFFGVSKLGSPYLWKVPCDLGIASFGCMAIYGVYEGVKRGLRFSYHKWICTIIYVASV